MELNDLVVYFGDNTSKRYPLDPAYMGFNINNNVLAINHYWDNEDEHDNKYLLKELYETEFKGKNIIKAAIEQGHAEYIVKDIQVVDFTIVYTTQEGTPRETIRFANRIEE